MSRFYPSLKKPLAKLIKKFGVACKVRTEIVGTYDPSTGGVTGNQINEVQAYCLFDNLNYDFPRYGDTGASQGTDVMVAQGDVLIYVTAEGKPSLNAIIEVNDEQWKVINCQPIKPANSALLYQLQARKVS